VPRGLAKIDELAKAAKARSDAYTSGEGLHRALMLKDGQTCRGRFLEEGNGIWYVYTHELPRKPGQQYGDKVLCLDQALTDAAVEGYVEGSTPCYGCELEGVARPTRVIINFIRYDEPKLVRDAKGNPVKNGNDYVFDGVEPTLVVCNFATGVGSRLAFLESQYGVGITNHVVTIHKTGDKNNPFMIDVVQANVAPDHPDVVASNGGKEFERRLFEKKVSPPEAIKSVMPKFKAIPLMSYGDMKRAYSGASVPSGFQGGGAPATSENTYAQAAASQVVGGHANLGAFGS
jgi:hypothetical protein